MRELVVATFAYWLHVQFVEFGFLIHLLVAERAGETFHAPSLVQSLEHVASDHVAAFETDVAEKLVEMRFAIRQAFLLVMPSSQKWFLAFGAYEMFDVPILAQSSHHAFLDWTTASTANRDAHLVVATKTVEVAFDFASIRC